MSSAGLTVSGVDFRINENAQEHLTQRFEVVHLSDPSVVLRRGQYFTIGVHFRNGQFDPSLHQLTIIFDLKPVSVRRSPWSRGEARLGQSVDTALGWKAALKQNNGNQALIQVADQVHMPEEQLLDEYVYNDVGKLYQRNGEEIIGQHWIYGQFDKSAILAAIKVLELSDLTPQERGNPVAVSRAITYMANSTENENGILEGYWTSDEYPQPSTRPWEWTSSLQILEQYVRTGRPVKYGQCWVFAAVVNTVCRTLGMPTRTVTTIDSAHDHNRDLALSVFYDEHHQKMLHPIYNSGLDQEWSFHVWNETWMQRPDLPLGYGGWQAIDGTPQGLSEGKYQCGPASVEAIRKGQVGLLYNVGDFIAATNAEHITWKRQPNGEYRIIKVLTNKYGTAMYTKQPYTFDPNGDTDRANIIHRYKYPEGSLSERIFLMNAVNQLPLARTIYNVRRESWANDIEVKLAEISYVTLGQELKIPFRIKNKSNESHEVKAAIAAVSMFYNGLQGHFLHRVERTYHLAPGRGKF
ncbi:hemocyte protein-glutamine gamma-glutamyltransferase-like [Hetaerina americana]|uniref:hemocyte protein-glutamine gamma-glutamyltransferase-like n=1 Tax=Hetaerina americana TaxID=62018 RepID=UPI003A7F13AA